jgi:hypothetical protein
MTTEGKEPEVGNGSPSAPPSPDSDATNSQRGESRSSEAKSEPSPEVEAGPSAATDPRGRLAPPGESDPIAELRERVTAAAEGFLKARLGLEEGADGSLHLPDRGVFENVGQRADQFLRGFLKGVVERTPEEREVDAGLRDKADVPNATEVVGRLLSRASGAVSTTFHQYLKDNVVTDNSQVVVDGRFLLQHGAPLLAGFVQALGQQFADKPAGAPSDELEGATADSPGEKPAPKVDYKVDLPSLFTSLFVRPRDDKGGGP